MIPGLEKVSLYTGKGNRDILMAVFHREFRGSTFTPSTVSKHVGIYKDAVRFGVLDRFRTLGNTAAGRWTEVVNLVLAKRLTQGTSL